VPDNNSIMVTKATAGSNLILVFEKKCVSIVKKENGRKQNELVLLSASFL